MSINYAKIFLKKTGKTFLTFYEWPFFVVHCIKINLVVDKKIKISILEELIYDVFNFYR